MKASYLREIGRKGGNLGLQRLCYQPHRENPSLSERIKPTGGKERRETEREGSSQHGGPILGTESPEMCVDAPVSFK